MENNRQRLTVDIILMELQERQRILDDPRNGPLDKMHAKWLDGKKSEIKKPHLLD